MQDHDHESGEHQLEVAALAAVGALRGGVPVLGAHDVLPIPRLSHGTGQTTMLLFSKLKQNKQSAKNKQKKNKKNKQTKKQKKTKQQNKTNNNKTMTDAILITYEHVYGGVNGCN